jgi:Fe-S cluster biogenesis protein NfuA
MKKDLLTKKVELALDEIRPFLISDGGDISLISIDKNIVKVQLMGNCVSCSVNQMTLKNENNQNRYFNNRWRANGAIYCI